jgi:carbonic anhydrase/acetyltransferase-like protein (isoleucine patch superfamily)
VYLAGCALSYGGAAWATRASLAPLAARTCPWAYVVPGVPLFLALAMMPAIVVHRVLPRLRPGIYRMGESAFVLWVVRFVFQRVLNLWPMRQLFFYSHVLRWALLNGLGSRVAFSTLMASDVTVLDWQMLRIGRGCTIGTIARFYTHFIQNDRLFVGEISLGDGAEIAAECTVGLSSAIGAGARVSFRATIGPFCKVGANAMIREGVTLGERTVVGEGAVVEALAVVAPGTKIGDGERWGGNPAVRLADATARPRRSRAASR